MAILQPNQMDFSDKKFSMIISGPPGVGKTTLALSAPGAILIDFDDGISRVEARYRKTTIRLDRYEDLISDMKSPEFQAAETIVIDTGGAFITYLQDWAMRTNPETNRKKNGGISQTGFGAVKSEFIRFTNDLRTIQKKNIIYVFHTVEEKNREGNIVQRLMCEGSARNIVWQPCDFGCFVFMQGSERYAGFTPTDEYFAKGSHGIKDLMRVPQLDEGTPNDFLTKLFTIARSNIAAEGALFEQENEKYQIAMDQGRTIVEGIVDADSAKDALESVKHVDHALTSEREIKAMIKARISELGLKWDKEKKAYVQAE